MDGRKQLQYPFVGIWDTGSLFGLFAKDFIQLVLGASGFFGLEDKQNFKLLDFSSRLLISATRAVSDRAVGGSANIILNWILII